MSHRANVVLEPPQLANCAAGEGEKVGVHHVIIKTVVAHKSGINVQFGTLTVIMSIKIINGSPSPQNRGGLFSPREPPN